MVSPNGPPAARAVSADDVHGGKPSRRRGVLSWAVFLAVAACSVVVYLLTSVAWWLKVGAAVAVVVGLVTVVVQRRRRATATTATGQPSS